MKSEQSTGAEPRGAQRETRGPNVALLELAATDGYPLAATLFEPDPERANGKVVLVNAATGVKRAYYSKYASYLSEVGFTVLTYDYRGVGGSRPKQLRGMQAAMQDWGEKDMVAVIDWLRARYPHSKLLALGHSVGGQVFGLTHNNREFAGLLLVSSQSGDLWLFDAPGKYVNLFFMYALVPVLTRALGYFPGSRFGLGEDLPASVGRQWAQWCRTSGYIYTDNSLTTRENFHRFTAPIYSLGFSDDTFAPRRATEALLAFYKNAPSQLEYLTPADVGLRQIGHFGFFREHGRETLWPRTLAWLEAQ